MPAYTIQVIPNNLHQLPSSCHQILPLLTQLLCHLLLNSHHQIPPLLTQLLCPLITYHRPNLDPIHQTLLHIPVASITHYPMTQSNTPTTIPIPLTHRWYLHYLPVPTSQCILPTLSGVNQFCLTIYGIVYRQQLSMSRFGIIRFRAEPFIAFLISH